MARLSRVTTEGIDRDSYYLYREETVLGRESGEIVFPDDEFLSRRHAAVQLNDAEAILHDLDSSNGTFLRIRGECRLVDSDELRVGSQLFRMEWPQ